MPPAQSLARLANEKVPFALAASWAEIGPPSERGTKNDCLECGEYASMRVYSSHAWCFACRTRFSAVRVLATVWETDAETAAIRALKKIGYVTGGYEQLWEAADRPEAPDLAALNRALVTWCAASIPGWTGRLEYEREPAGLLSECLRLLPLVRTEDECGEWMSGCQQVMARFAAAP